MKKILIILFLTISTVVSATRYYVSTSGNDANNGLTATYINSFVTPSSPNTIEINYDPGLAQVVPAVTAFSVKVNSVARGVTSVGIVAGEVKLTLDSPLVTGDITTLSYVKPATNPLQSELGALAEDITSKSVTNSVVTAIPETITTNPSNIKITVYPNPVHRILNILCEYTSTYSNQEAITALNCIRIFDLAGTLMLERKLEPGILSQQFPINLRSGVFVVLLISKGLTLSSQKFIVYN